MSDYLIRYESSDGGAPNEDDDEESEEDDEEPDEDEEVVDGRSSMRHLYPWHRLPIHISCSIDLSIPS